MLLCRCPNSGPCRQYLKHRAHKLTNPRARGKQAAGGGSPVISVDTR